MTDKRPEPVKYQPMPEALKQAFTGGFSELRYGIDLHSHRFAAWAASRAASVVNCRFSVVRGRSILEECGFDSSLSPERLPEPQDVDETHRKWRADIISAAASCDLTFTHGVAAKLVNVYLKSRFVCGGHHDHERVRALHPPIDSVLLETLAGLDVGGHAKEWNQAAKTAVVQARIGRLRTRDCAYPAYPGRPPVMADRRVLEGKSMKCSIYIRVSALDPRAVASTSIFTLAPRFGYD